jgi:hypothetical protein
VLDGIGKAAGQVMDGLLAGRRQAEDAGGFATQKSALDHALLAEALANSPRAVEWPTQKRGRETVAGYAPGWLEGQALLEANSVEIARSALKRIMPHLGSKAREDVAPEHVI